MKVKIESNTVARSNGRDVDEIVESGLKWLLNKVGESMDDRIAGSVIVAVGYLIAILIALWKDRKKEDKHRRMKTVFFILWMCALACYTIYHFMK